ncbi:MAG: elongator complex protein 3 [Patescibacteria group bacterium]
MSTSFDYKQHLDQLKQLFSELQASMPLSKLALVKLIKCYPKKTGGIFAKTELIEAYKKMTDAGICGKYDQRVIKQLQMKPVRTSSGVAPVTVLTKPFPCPGKCIFCPSDVRMPKSYLSNEPGAQRAERNSFDPYLQTYNRLDALYSMGHEIDKVELIILGGTWSFYPEKYQIWFIKECFRALNDFGRKIDGESDDDRQKIENAYESRINLLEENQHFALTNRPEINQKNTVGEQLDGLELAKTYNQVISELYVAPEKKLGLDEWQQSTWQELEEQQKFNETSKVRNVGLVVETRPDNISEVEVMRIRRLGCTKTQIGVQSMNDEVLLKNHRGHDVAATRRAFALLRQAGFKIHAHWMANLYGSSVKNDIEDFKRLFEDPDFCPDELKVYPCSLIQSAELMQYYQKGLWKPYSDDELLAVLTEVMLLTPPYCRLTRIVRDIPSQDIVVGNKKTNFRQIADKQLLQLGKDSQDIRAREIRREQFNMEKINYSQIEYQTSVSKEIFMQFTVPTITRSQEKLLGFLRLSLPKTDGFIEELKNSAIIREIHVYGVLTSLGNHQADKAQHIGLGKKLIEHAIEESKKHGFCNLAVISAIGTKEYYRSRGFKDGDLYQHLSI